MNFLSASVLLAVAACLAHGSIVATSGAAAPEQCSGTLTPTVTFNVACTTISLKDANCWTPRVPISTDVVSFPKGTAAKMPFMAFNYTPMLVTSVVVQASASVTMLGQGIQVSSCFQVDGELLLQQNFVDNGTGALLPYLKDPSVPHGTDCSELAAGFTPRVCGPGVLYISNLGTVTLSGMFSSIFAPTIIAAGGQLFLFHQSFLWGNVSNYGIINAANSVSYFHGELNNFGTAYFGQLRADVWAHYNLSKIGPVQNVTIFNDGILEIMQPEDQLMNCNYDQVSTLNTFDWTTGLTPIVGLTIVNRKNVSFLSSSEYCDEKHIFAGIELTLVNFGTTIWRGRIQWYGAGVAENYGTFVADESYVSYYAYVSNGGVLATMNGGEFAYGMGEKQTAMWTSRHIPAPHVGTAHFVGASNTIKSLDGTGSVRLLSSVIIDSPLTVLRGATLINGIGKMNEKSSLFEGEGSLDIQGSYIAGADEKLSKQHNVQLSRSGLLIIPAGKTLTLAKDANRVHFARGSVVALEGTLVNQHAGEGVSDGNGAKFCSHVSGKGKATGAHLKCE